jgi:hypothetical protein
MGNGDQLLSSIFRQVLFDEAGQKLSIVASAAGSHQISERTQSPSHDPL